MEVILLGAGCSKEAEVPLSRELSKSIVNYWPEDDAKGDAFEEVLREFSQVYRFVAGGLAFHSSANGLDPFQGVDIEEMFNALLILSTKESFESAPFISSWHPAVNKFDQMSDFQFGRFTAKLRAEIYDPLIGGVKNAKDFSTMYAELFRSVYGPRKRVVHEVEFQDAFRRAVRAALGLSTPGRMFKDALRAMQVLVAELVFVSERKRTLYLCPLVRYASRKHLSICTLNYDNTIELAAEIESIGVDCGLKEWIDSGKIEFQKDKLPLLKLHGSIDWKVETRVASARTPVMESRIELIKLKSKSDFNHQPALIFGHRNKLTAEGPFLSLFLKFAETLEKASLLSIIGYSFRDDHINKLITSWLNGSKKRAINVVNGPDFELDHIPFVDKNNRKFLESRIRIHKITASKWIEKLK